ncbi:hypothetical protein [Nocardia crassostreae]|uniref:hypothetical protein n=1 Tax=Nocardia crassostreae TaxID=53428 RepID=UPI0008317210|nr:hypothetical protein [Nocardia crassostreae]
MAFPSRGLGPAQPIEPGPEVFERAALSAAQRDRIADNFDYTAACGAQDLVEAGAEALRDAAAATPLGAAVCSLAVELATGFFTRPGAYYTADDWVRERGLVFAADAAAWRAALTCTGKHDSAKDRYIYALRRFAPHQVEFGNAGPLALHRMRDYLAVASEDDYRAAVARLEPLRTTPGGIAARVATSFLAPTETEWVAADLDSLIAQDRGYRNLCSLLAASVYTSADLEKVLRACGANTLLHSVDRRLLYSVLVRLGPACAAALDRMLYDRNVGDNSVQLVADILSRFPTDEAFTILVNRAEQRFIPTALAAAAQRFPQRALRLLRPVAEHSPSAQLVLRTLASARPELIPELPADTGFVDPRARTADQTNLPAILRNPPWQGTRKMAKPTVIPGIAAHRPTGLAWRAGEREEWESIEVHGWYGLR